MAGRVEMTSPASPGTVFVQESLVGRFQAQGWAVVSSASAEKAKPRVKSSPKKK